MIFTGSGNLAASWLSDLGEADVRSDPTPIFPSKSIQRLAVENTEDKLFLFVAAANENHNHLVRSSSHVGAVLRTSEPCFAPKGTSLVARQIS
jgi:hypothetical protein